MGLLGSNTDIDTRIIYLLREVIPWQFSKKEIRPEMSLQSDLGIDSLGRAAFVFRVEEEFKIKISELAGTIGDIRTVKDVLEVSRQLLEQVESR